MNLSRTKAIALYFTAMVILFITSCINHIQDEEIPVTTVTGDIPIRINTQILCAQTRVNNDEFENDDAIGVYVLVQPSSLNQKRYIENARFTCNSLEFAAEEDLYYPQGSSKCDFISYYPYQSSGIEEGEHKINISIKADQSSLSSYSTSDFMIARMPDVVPSKMPVILKHTHQLSKLKIVIQPISGEDIANLLNSSPSIIINKVYTQATYDFELNNFTLPINKQNITPYGEWSIVEKKLIGKSAILFPQTIEKGTQLLAMRINGKSYPCVVSDDLVIEAGKNCELTLSFSSQQGISSVKPSIGEWEEGNHMEIIPGEGIEGNEIFITDFDFEQTDIYHIVYQGEIIAEVCREYLLSDNLDAQAIIIYPVKEGKCDWNEGIVLQILNKKEEIHGGKISWNIQTNSFTYEVGSSAPIASFYIASDQSISVSQPENSLSINIEKKMLADSRGSETTLYPIVKIGIQYWMRENLRTTLYNEGSKITFKNNLSSTTAGYFQNPPSDFFYNKAAVLTEHMAPQGWKIPNSMEWEKLQQYTNNVAAVLKAGTSWENSTGTIKANNKSGFSTQPTGFYSKNTNDNSSIFGFINKYAAFWSTENSPNTLSENGICLKYNENTIGIVKYNDYGAYSIRCLKE